MWGAKKEQVEEEDNTNLASALGTMWMNLKMQTRVNWKILLPVPAYIKERSSQALQESASD